MKYSLLIILAEFMILVDSGVKDYKFVPNLPLGEYKLKFIAFLPCNVNLNSSMQYNLFLFKTSRNTTDLRGNISIINMEFDDSFSIHVRLDIKDTIGGWQNNAYLYKSPHAYTIHKEFLGAEYSILFNRFEMNKTNYSIPPGIYVSSKGYDVSNYPSNTNLPKQFFYGTYKLNIVYTDKNGNKCGCLTFVIEVKRPWETE